jgi:uncharacterized protein (DUF1778 family)
MTKEKTVSVNFRLHPELRELLQLAADLERRSMTNMLEVLILDYCKRQHITVKQSVLESD